MATALLSSPKIKIINYYIILLLGVERIIFYFKANVQSIMAFLLIKMYATLADIVLIS